MTDLGIYRPSTSSFFFTFSPDFTGTDMSKVFGTAGDSPILADVNGDAQADIGVWRDGTGGWSFLCSPGFTWNCVNQIFGTSGDVPIYGLP